MREKYITEQKAQHQERFERAYGLNDGPYLLGQNVCIHICFCLRLYFTI